jgi:hypothetical protein
MRPIRAFLLVHSNSNWEVSIHRDLNDLRDHWHPYSEQGATGIIHVGLDRPDTEQFSALATQFPGRMILTASARWALLPVCECMPTAIGDADGIPVYIALNGWGYEASVDEFNVERESISQASPIVTGNYFPSEEEAKNWVVSLGIDNPGLALIAASEKIIDEKSYHEKEQFLDASLRRDLGLYRYKILSSNDDPDDPIEIVKHAPLWILDVGFNHLNLNVRTTNVVNTAKLLKVRDLLKFSLVELQHLPAFGKGSQVHLAQRLREVIKQGPAGSDLHSHASSNIDSCPSPSIESPASRFQFARTLCEVIRLAISSLDTRNAKVISCRMGLDTEPMTLQELSDDLRITRERVRQLETKGMIQIGSDPVWRNVLAFKLSSLLSHRSDPLPLSGLAILDPWFQGVEQLFEPFRYLLDHESILDNRFTVLYANRQYFVTTLKQREWDSLVKQAMFLLENGVQYEWPLSEARQQVEFLLSGDGRELRSELWVTAKQFANFSVSTDDEPRLISYGRSAEALVEAVLAESEYPLHYSEIARLVQQRYGKSIDIRRVQNAANVATFLFGRGIYGLMKHCPLNQSEIEKVREITSEIIFQGPDSRQWSCAELVDLLSQQGLDFDGRLTHYVLDAILQGSSELHKLGRFMWARSSSTENGAKYRIDMRQATLSLLIQAGKPLTTSEIKETLQKDRGINHTFQIHPNGSLIRVAPGQWGLVERDLPLDKYEQAKLVEEIHNLLRRRGKGIHISEISKCLGEIYPPASRINYPEAIFSLAQRSSDFRVSQGEYLFLSEWEGPRRLSTHQAIIESLRQAGAKGLRTREIIANASERLGRQLERDAIYGALRATGVQRNESEQRWVLQDMEKFEDEEIGVEAH